MNTKLGAELSDRQQTDRKSGAAEILGHLLYLMMASKDRSRWSARDIRRHYLPSIQQGLFRIYFEDGKPFGFVCWAELSEEVKARWLAGGYDLKAEDLRSGDIVWILDTVSPFGKYMKMRDAYRRERLFAGKRVFSFRVFKGRPGMRIIESTLNERGEIRWIDHGRVNDRFRGMQISGRIERASYSFSD